MTCKFLKTSLSFVGFYVIKYSLSKELSIFVILREFASVMVYNTKIIARIMPDLSSIGGSKPIKDTMKEILDIPLLYVIILEA